jgi:hypothetical protein
LIATRTWYLPQMHQQATPSQEMASKRQEKREEGKHLGRSARVPF